MKCSTKLDERIIIRHIGIMALLKIAKMGHSVLHQVAELVEDPTSPEAAAIVEDMLETLEDSGGLGLAAPQVHIPKRIVTFFVPENRTSEDENDGPEELKIMVNPEIEYLTEEKELDWEGCLSVPYLMGSVPRYTKIRYSWTDLSGTRKERVAIGFHARTVQHECDHLDGILYPMRMTDFRLLGFEEEINRNPKMIKAGAAPWRDVEDEG